jgi:hypothetical protein
VAPGRSLLFFLSVLGVLEPWWLGVKNPSEDAPSTKVSQTLFADASQHYKRKMDRTAAKDFFSHLAPLRFGAQARRLSRQSLQIKLPFLSGMKTLSALAIPPQRAHAGRRDLISIAQSSKAINSAPLD